MTCVPAALDGAARETETGNASSTRLRYSTEIVGNELQMLGGRGGAAGAAGAPAESGSRSSSPAPSYAEESGGGGGSRSKEFDDEIPF